MMFFHHNPRVGGSSPSSATKNLFKAFFYMMNTACIDYGLDTS